MNYITYIIGQGDTLTIIAMSQLNTDDINSIVSANNLRYPYISDEPIDQYSHPKGQLQLQGTLQSGSSSCTFGNSNSVQVQKLDTMFIEEWTTGKSEALVVSSVQNNSDGTVTITFQSKTTNTYTVAAVATDFVNQENVITKVLKTGDTLYLPLSSVNTSFTATTQSNIYGTDIKVDDNGFIVRGSNDLSTVTGIDNIEQGVSLRWQTPYGAHPFHETYGNRAFELVGEESEPYYWMLYETFATQCAMSDPRVDSIDNMQLSTQDDKVFSSADITPINSNASFTVSTLIGGE